MQRIRNKWNEYNLLIIMLLIAVTIIYGQFLFSGNTFITGNDFDLQHRYYFEEWTTLFDRSLSEGSIQFYSWNTFLGTDFYSARATNIIGDPLFYLNTILNLSFSDFMLFEYLAYSVLSAGFMFKFFGLFGIRSKEIRSFAAIIYSFSGWAVMFTSQPMFFRFYCLLPLLFYGVEKYLVKKKPAVFVMAVFLLFMQNTYLMFPTSLFLFMYSIARYYYFNDSLKGILKTALIMIIYYLLGFLLSCFLTLPGILYVLKNSRVGESSTFLLWDFNVYLGLLVNYVSYNFPGIHQIPDLFYTKTNGDHGYYYSLYASAFSLTSVISMFWSKNKRFIRSFGYLFVVLTVILLVPPLNSMMHGFSNPSLRWSFLNIFLVVLIMAEYLDKHYDHRIFMKNYLILFAVSIVLLLAYVLVNNAFNEYASNIAVIVISYVLGLIFIWIYPKNRNAAIFLTVIYSSLLGAGYLYYASYDYNQYDFEYTIDKVNFEYFDSMEDDLAYRMYVDNLKYAPYLDINQNQSIYYGYMGTATYDTMYEPELEEFLLLNNPDHWHMISIDNYKLLNMLGVKYYIVSDRTELPDDGEFEYAYNLNHLEVYKDKNYHKLGFTYRGLATNPVDFMWDPDTYAYVDKTMYFETDWDSESKEFNLTEMTGNYVYGNITTESNSVMFFSIPYNKGWEIYDNGNPVEYRKINGGFIGFNLKPGYHEIGLYFTPVGFKTGSILSLGSAGILVLIYVLNRLKQRRG